MLVVVTLTAKLGNYRFAQVTKIIITIVESAACRVLEMVRNAGLQADCIFYTTLISACAKAGRIDLMFKVCGTHVFVSRIKNNHSIIILRYIQHS